MAKTWFIEYTIRVTYTNLKFESITAYATNKKDFTSEYRKLNYVINYELPKVIKIEPNGDICKTIGNKYRWKFFMNRNSSSPLSSSFIRFVSILNVTSFTQVYQFDTFLLRNKNSSSFSISTPSSKKI
jgi:hypothetical protein